MCTVREQAPAECAAQRHVAVALNTPGKVLARHANPCSPAWGRDLARLPRPIPRSFNCKYKCTGRGSLRDARPLCQSHRDLNSGLRPVGVRPDLDMKKAVSTGSDLISIAGIPVVPVAGSHHDGWTVLRTCDLDSDALLGLLFQPFNDAQGSWVVL